MSISVQRRRGTTAEHSTFTGAVGELTIDTDKKTVVVHDGSTAGGQPLAIEGHIFDVPVDLTGLDDGYILYYDLATNSIKVKPDEGGGGDAGLVLYQYTETTIPY